MGSTNATPRIGLLFGYWDYVPWIGLYGPNNIGDWAVPGNKFDFNMLTWRHTCISLNVDQGVSVMFENGKFAGEKEFDGYTAFGEDVPNFVATSINFGCDPVWNHSHSGIVTDFQLFGRVLNRQELEDWTGCKERLRGDIVDWDEEDWLLEKKGNGTRIEYLEFEKVVCDMRDLSHHFFPVKRTFRKSSEFCEKLSGKLNE